MENILKELRQQGKNKAIAIGSTGIGKTFFAVLIEKVNSAMNSRKN